MNITLNAVKVMGILNDYLIVCNIIKVRVESPNPQASTVSSGIIEYIKYLENPPSTLNEQASYI